MKGVKQLIDIQYLKPFFTKVSGTKLRLVFAYQYLSISKEDLIYHFVPLEGKEILINLQTRQIENLSEVFVFQNGNRFIRMPLYQFVLVSNVMNLIEPYIDNETVNETTSTEFNEITNYEVEEIIIRSLIDRALDIGDEALFMELAEQLKVVVSV